MPEPMDASSRFKRPVDLLRPPGGGESAGDMVAAWLLGCRKDVASRFEKEGSLFVNEMDSGRRCLVVQGGVVANTGCTGATLEGESDISRSRFSFKRGGGR